MSELAMELRNVAVEAREIVGRVAPYDQTSYLTGTAGGERMVRGCFAKSIAQRGTKVPLVIGHNHRDPAVGLATGWEERSDGLVATFRVRDDEAGDKVLRDAADGYLAALSVGYEPLNHRRGRDGAVEVTEGRLHEVSLVAVGAYRQAEVLAVRSAEQIAADVEAMLAPFRNPPRVDMSPLPPVWAYDPR